MKLQKPTILMYFLTLTMNIAHASQEQLEINVRSRIGAGFFCCFMEVVENIIHFEKNNLMNVIPDWTHQFFPYKDKPSENGWSLFFEPSIINVMPYNDKLPIKKITHETGHGEIFHTRLWAEYDQLLSHRLFVHEKIKQYIKIKNHITEKVETFYNTYMQNHICIGVHVRYANAHIHEVPGGKHPDLNEYKAEIDVLIKLHPTTPIKIFLASDSNSVINHFKKIYPNSTLVYIDAFRSSEAQDPNLVYENPNYWTSHPTEFHQKKPGCFGGETTLLDGLLLSKCDYLIHTTSNVSTFVSLMNPYIKSIYLPKNMARIILLNNEHNNDKWYIPMAD
jgi:hypothetical protein